MVGGPPAQLATWEIDIPVFLILGLIVVLALGLARGPDSEGQNLWQRNGIIGQAVFVWVGLAALIGAVGLATLFGAIDLGGNFDTGALPSVTGGLGAVLMPEFMADPFVLPDMDRPPLSFRPLNPMQLFAASAGVALILLLVKDGFGSPPGSEERGLGGQREREIDPLKVVLPPLPKAAPTFLRPRGIESGAPTKNPREPRTFGRRQT
jgi:hypothetical protein